MASEEYYQNDQIQVPEFDIKYVKKLNHNASERDRRKKINSLYSSLRSLLPATDQRVRFSFYLNMNKYLQPYIYTTVIIRVAHEFINLAEEAK